MAEDMERKETGGMKPVDVWVGTALGILKGVSLAKREVTNYCKSMEMADRTQEVCAMCWEHGAQGDILYCGLKNGLVQRFSCSQRVFEAECDCTGGEGVFIGLGKHEETMITCTDRGDLCFWPPDAEKTYCNVRNSVSVMVPSPDTMLQVATGGRENELKVWDGNNTESPIFQAKNVKNDKLDLRVPVWVSAIGYVSGSGPQPTLAVATGYHQVRLYDTRVQRRPVFSVEFGEHPFTALTTMEDGRSFVVGDSIGEISRCDLRTGQVINHYKGCLGGVKSVQCCQDNEGNTLLASCSLDRYLRVYTLQPPKLLHKVYLKLLPSCLLFSGASLKDNVVMEEVSTRKQGVSRTRAESEGEDEEEEDDVWKAMETVSESNLKSKGKFKTHKKKINNFKHSNS